MTMFVEGRGILDEFQMDVAVTVPVQTGVKEEIVSYDPFLPANNVTGTSNQMSQFVQSAGGWEDVNRANWYTTHKLQKGTKVQFAEKSWTIVGLDDYASTSFTDVFFYKLQESETLQTKEAGVNGEW